MQPFSRDPCPLSASLFEFGALLHILWKRGSSHQRQQLTGQWAGHSRVGSAFELPTRPRWTLIEPKRPEWALMVLDGSYWGAGLLGLGSSGVWDWDRSPGWIKVPSCLWCLQICVYRCICTMHYVLKLSVNYI